MILAGDVGGTKCRLAIYEEGPGASGLRPRLEDTFLSRDYPSLEAVVEDFLSNPAVEGMRDKLSTACFGVAGPVVDDRVRTSNLPWTVEVAALKRATGIQRILLINDLEATVYGVLVLESDDLERLNECRPEPGGTRALIAAGTGLGEAIIAVGRDGVYFPVSSEGGHADFAPRNPTEMELLQHLTRRWPHVSYERVLSGPGLLNIYRFLRDLGLEEPKAVASRIEKAEDPSAEISRAAQAGESDRCARAMDLFVSIYGAEAGNLALKAKSTGGLYIGGGIAPKIRDRIIEGAFMQSFYAKGRLRSLLETIPVYLVLNSKAALLGAGVRGLQEKNKQ
ncbi:MAG: glucokinase [Acidobacteriota bacterium]